VCFVDPHYLAVIGVLTVATILITYRQNQNRPMEILLRGTLFILFLSEFSSQISVGSCDDLIFYPSTEDYDYNGNLCEAIVPIIFGAIQPTG